jgi:hypothetical protein
MQKIMKGIKYFINCCETEGIIIYSHYYKVYILYLNACLMGEARGSVAG